MLPLNRGRGCCALWMCVLLTHLFVSVHCRHTSVHAVERTFHCWLLSTVVHGEESAAVSLALTTASQTHGASYRWSVHTERTRRWWAIRETAALVWSRSTPWVSGLDDTFQWGMAVYWRNCCCVSSTSIVFLENTYTIDSLVHFPWPGTLP